jgi:glycosyltransferase involved in cell wall biosynthesis
VDEIAVRRERERWAIPLNSPLLLYVGRLAREKNVELVVDSFARIADEFPHARLLIVGTGPHAETLKRRASDQSGAERVIFAGPLPRSELDSIYAASDLLVFGSSTETQGLVVAEARATGTPAVVVDEGGAPETVKHGEDGLVVSPETDEFAAAIRSLLKYDNVRLEMRAACLRKARRYTPSAMADRVMEVYNSVVREAPAADPVAAIPEN